MEKDFFQQVYQIVRLIPYGRVTSYGAIAKCLGTPKSSRMVGWALGQCSSESEFVPAHRVVNRNGLLTGKAAFVGENSMEQLLLSEGVKVVDNKIQDFKKVYWDPFTEL